MTRTDEIAQWAQRSRELRARAEAVRAMRRVRLERACADAGIGGYHGCILHNALISAQQGQPWPGVDTALLRAAKRLESTMYEAENIVGRWASRTMPI